MTFDSHAHSTPHKTVQDLAHAIEGLDSEILQQTVGRTIMKHGFELVSNGEKENEHDPNLSHLDTEGVFQASQVIVKQWSKAC